MERHFDMTHLILQSAKPRYLKNETSTYGIIVKSFRFVDADIENQFLEFQIDISKIYDFTKRSVNAQSLDVA